MRQKLRLVKRPFRSRSKLCVFFFELLMQLHCIRGTYFHHLQLDLYCAGDTNVTKDKLIAKAKLAAETKAAEKKSKKESKKASQREIISVEDLSLNSAVTPEQPQQPTFMPPMPHLTRVFPKKKPEPKVSTVQPLVTCVSF